MKSHVNENFEKMIEESIIELEDHKIKERYENLISSKKKKDSRRPLLIGLGVFFILGAAAFLFLSKKQGNAMHKMSTPYLAEMELYRNPDLNTRGDEMRPPLDWAAVYEKSAEGKHLEAIQLITDSDPAKHSATKSYLKAQLYLKANQLDQAESAVNSLLNGSKGELKEEGLWLKALILIQKGEEAQAKILLKEIITNKQYMWLEAQKLITQ